MDNGVKETLSIPELLYDAGMGNLIQAEKFGVGSMDRTNYLLQAIAHALLGALRDGLDYAAKNADRTVPIPPEFEEDDTRP